MTIEVPTPSSDLIAQIETATINADQGELAAVRAIRERFTPFAKHNGFIKTASYARVESNYRVGREAYHERDGKRVKSLLVYDNFIERSRDQNRGDLKGDRLYLTEFGEWLRIERVGSWSCWQGEPTWWVTDGQSADTVEVSDEAATGSARVISDADVVAEYDLDDILSELGKAMTEMTKKLPQRYSGLIARAELAARVIAALAEGK